MSFLGYEQSRKSVKCERKKCDECVNRSGNCGCQCHEVRRKNEIINEIREVRQLADYYNDQKILKWILRVMG